MSINSNGIAPVRLEEDICTPYQYEGFRELYHASTGQEIKVADEEYYYYHWRHHFQKLSANAPLEKPEVYACSYYGNPCKVSCGSKIVYPTYEINLPPIVEILLEYESRINSSESTLIPMTNNGGSVTIYLPEEDWNSYDLMPKSTEPKSIEPTFFLVTHRRVFISGRETTIVNPEKIVTGKSAALQYGQNYLKIHEKSRDAANQIKEFRQQYRSGSRI